VGDDSQINIWEGSWIPSSRNLKIMTPRGTNILTRVSDLINPIDGSWDEDIIEDIFLADRCSQNIANSFDTK
jgi:hypothetical protein